MFVVYASLCAWECVRLCMAVCAPEVGVSVFGYQPPPCLLRQGFPPKPALTVAALAQYPPPRLGLQREMTVVDFYVGCGHVSADPLAQEHFTH